MARSHRLFELVQVLRRHRMTVSGLALANELGVSLRTIRRDVATLQSIGVEVEGEPGIGYILRPGSLLPPLSFTEDELHALLIGAQWVSRQADSLLAQAVANALAKINAVLPTHLRPMVDDDAIYISYPAKSAMPLNLSEVRQAIREQRKLRIKLPATHTLVGEHLIWPIILGFIDGERFIAAWCETGEQFNVFEMSEIESAEVMLDRYPRNRRELVKAWQAQDLKPCNSRE